MDRNALLLYLQNVRDLEVARYWLRVKYQRENQNYKNQKSRMQQTNFRALPEKPGGLGCLFWGLIVFTVLSLCMAFLLSAFGQNGESFALVCVMFFCALIFGCCAMALYMPHQKERDKYQRDHKEIIRHNQLEVDRVKQNEVILSKLEETWQPRNVWYQQEIGKRTNLLKAFYDMNIIPVQFRNVSAICYIYDYMSTSQESLTTALFDQHMEDGIRRLEAKLDSIISNLETMVYETRCIRQNSERMIAQNSGMLESLQRTESNTLQAAQYAQLSANYSKANAYFSLATYLKN